MHKINTLSNNRSDFAHMPKLYIFFSCQYAEKMIILHIERIFCAKTIYI